MSKVELLSPAGSFEALIAAIQNGADAVYLGGKMYNARQQASNFDDEKLKEAVEYAHLRDKKTYLTLNTLINNRELSEIYKYLAYTYEIGIDGIIVQDLGVARLIKELIPKMPLHASTQMTIHNLEGVKELERLGFQRAVLARELTLEEIQLICQNTSLEIEVFIHGALCVCYSGQCLMSSFIGGRSGNRGMCAQPCRLPYDITDIKEKSKRTGYILSPKDICTIRNIGDVIGSGVKSLKIEGRLKRPEYVAIVTGIYRKYIDKYFKGEDSFVSNEDYDNLLQIFNRGQFTKGYIFDKPGKSIMAHEKPNNWGVYLGTVEKYNPKNKTFEIILKNTLEIGDSIEFWNEKYDGLKVEKIYKSEKEIKSAKKDELVSISTNLRLNQGTKVYKTSSTALLEQAAKSYRDENIKIPIKMDITIQKGSPLMLKISDGQKNVEITGATAEEAINKPLTKERVIEQLSKLGSTAYEYISMDVNMSSDVAVPISELNLIRRTAIEELTKARLAIKNQKINIDTIESKSSDILKIQNHKKNQKTKLSAYFNNIIDIDGIETKIDKCYIPVTKYLTDKEKTLIFIDGLKKANIEVYLAMPRIIPQDLMSPIAGVIRNMNNINGILLTGIGQARLFEDRKFEFCSDFSFNVFNNLSARVLEEMKIKEITLSLELNLGQIKELIKNSEMDYELIVYGRLPLMISRYCPGGSIFGGDNGKCSKKCLENYQLIDRMNNRFPIQTNRIACQSEILNCKKLFLGEELEKILSLNPKHIRLYFTDEQQDEIASCINFHRDFIDNGCIGHEYNDYISKMKNNFTKGHYFRGVE